MRWIAELRRRRVLRVAGLYLVGAWAVLQVSDVTVPALGAPTWVMTLLTITAIVGFPISFVLGWFFDFTKSGVVRTLPSGRDPTTDEELALQPFDYGVLFLSLAVVGGIAFGTFTNVSQNAIESSGREFVSAPPRSIAVLPFVSLSSDLDTQFFGDGVAEEILNRLAQIQALKVTARTSSFSFKGQNIDIRSIAGMLGVETILEGSIRKAGNQIRVTAQLINASDGFHLWSDNFDRDFDGIFDVQDEIARSIAEALKIELLDDASIGRRPTENMEAYESYLRGRFLVQNLEEESLLSAIGHFRTAIDLDPGFAGAWAGLAEARVLLYTYNVEYLEYGDLATDRSALKAQAEIDTRPALLEALALAPDSPEAYASLALYQWYFDMDIERAMGSVRQALELSPNHGPALKYLGLLLLYSPTDGTAALPELEKARDINPMDVNANRFLSVAYYRSGLIEKAIETNRYILKLDPDHFVTLKDMALGLTDAGRPDEGLIYARRALEINPQDPQALGIATVTYQALGDFTRSFEGIEAMKAASPQNHMIFYAASDHYLMLGEYDNLESLVLEYLDRTNDSDELNLFDQGILVMAYKLYSNTESYPEAERINDIRVRGPFMNQLNQAEVHADRAYTYWKLGMSRKYEEAVSSAEKMLFSQDDVVKDSDLSHRVQALIAVTRSDNEAAISHLEKLVAANPGYKYWMILAEPAFRQLQGFPVFDALIARLRTNTRKMRERAYAQLAVTDSN